MKLKHCAIYQGVLRFTDLRGRIMKLSPLQLKQNKQTETLGDYSEVMEIQSSFREARYTDVYNHT